MTKRKVQLWGQPQSYATVEDGATRGAVLGATLFLPSGAVLTLQGLAEALGTLPAPAQPAPGGVIRTPSVTVWGLIQQIPPNILEAAALTGNGLIVRQADGNWLVRELEGVAGRTVVMNGAGEAGNPVIDLAELPDAGTGALLKFTRDDYGRVAGTVPADMVDLGHAVLLEASGAVSALRAVRLLLDGSAVLYPAINNLADADRVIGISTTASAGGTDVVVQVSGEIVDASWSWNAGVIWCDDGGVLTQTLPTSGSDYWLLPIGRATSPTSLVVDIGTPIQRTV